MNCLFVLDINTINMVEEIVRHDAKVLYLLLYSILIITHWLSCFRYTLWNHVCPRLIKESVILLHSSCSVHNFASKTVNI